MVRILNIVECMQAAGIESYIMNVYRHIDREKIQFDFWITREEKEFYDDEIEKLGGKKYTTNRMNIKNTGIRVFLESIDLYKFLKKNKYEVIEVHTGTPLRFMYLIAAKMAGVRKRIYHSHSAEVFGPHKGLLIKKIIFSFIKNFIPVFATDLFACSEAAGKWMYPRKYQDKVEIIYNGIDTKKFKFNDDIRKEYRNKENVTNEIILGHVARFNEQKNHTFLIDVFKEVVKENSNYQLWLIGSGELEEQIKEKVKKLNLNKNVKFFGVRNDVNKIMQAIDIFVLPSNYEGLPVVGIEAQFSGVQCFFSDKITKEVEITQNVKFIKLDIKDWKYNILHPNIQDRNIKVNIKNSSYDIENTINKLMKIYSIL